MKKGTYENKILKYWWSVGYEVHGTVRSLKNKQRLQHLYDSEKEFPQGKLILFEADLGKKGSFDSAIEGNHYGLISLNLIQGCTYVIHTAAPVEVVYTDPIKNLVEPAIEGTKNVLDSCGKSKSVKRIVMTSSVWAVTSWCEDRGKNYQFTEKDFNDWAQIEYGKFWITITKIYSK